MRRNPRRIVNLRQRELFLGSGWGFARPICDQPPKHPRQATNVLRAQQAAGPAPAAQGRAARKDGVSSSNRFPARCFLYRNIPDCTGTGERRRPSQSDVDLLNSAVWRFASRPAHRKGRARPSGAEGEPSDGRDRAEREVSGYPREERTTPVLRKGFRKDKKAEDEQKVEGRAQIGHSAAELDDLSQGQRRSHSRAKDRPRSMMLGYSCSSSLLLLN